MREYNNARCMARLYALLVRIRAGAEIISRVESIDFKRGPKNERARKNQREIKRIP